MRAKGLTPKEMGSIASDIIEDTLPSVDNSIQIGREEYAERWKKVQRAMGDKGYDFLYVCGSELDRSDAAWLAGVFDPIIERYGVLVPQEGVPVVLAGSEGGHVLEEAAGNSGAKITLLREFQISDEEYRWAHFMSLDKVLSQIGLEGEGKTIAIASSAQFIPHDHVLMFKSKFGADKVILSPEVLQLIKYEKTDTELAVMQQANIIADAALRGMLAVTVPGVTELQVAGVGDFIVKELGAGRSGFPTIVTAGDRGYTVIGPATNNVIHDGDIVSLGASPTFNGYHGVVRRTVRAGTEPAPDQREFIGAVEQLYVVIMDAVKEAARKNLASNYIDQQGKAYLSKLKLRTVKGDLMTPHEPYTFVHNTGCSECQEGYGAVTPKTENTLGNKVSLMVDVALLGFMKKGEPLFPVLYAVVEDAFWKSGMDVGVYNKLPLNVQHLVGNSNPIGENINPYHKEFKLAFHK